MPAGTRSRGTRPRQATMPVNSGRSAPNTAKRTRDCTPSAPIASGAVTGSPRSNSMVTQSVVLRDADALAIEMDRVRPLAADRVEQHGVQIAAVEHHVGKAVALDRDRAEIEQLPGLAGAPEPDLLAGDDDAEPLGRLAEAQRIEHARAVRADLHAGAELLQLGRLLIDIDADALPDQRQRRGQAADAGADDGNVLVCHGAIGPELSCPRRRASSQTPRLRAKTQVGDYWIIR